MKKEWRMDLAGEKFAVSVRAPAGANRTVVFEVDRLGEKRERLGEIHEQADGAFRVASFENESAKITLDALIPLLRRKFHAETTSLKKAGR